MTKKQIARQIDNLAGRLEALQHAAQGSANREVQERLASAKNNLIQALRLMEAE